MLQGSHPEGLVITKGDKEVRFDSFIQTCKGILYVCKLRQSGPSARGGDKVEEKMPTSCSNTEAEG